MDHTVNIDCSDIYEQILKSDPGDIFGCKDTRTNDTLTCTVLPENGFHCEQDGEPAEPINKFEGSTMQFSADEAAFIDAQLPYTKYAANLLFRGSRDGWAPSTFKTKVSGVGATLVCFKSQRLGRRSCGFTSINWYQTSTAYKQDTTAILMDIEGKQAFHGFDDTTAIYGSPNLGPWFGSTVYGDVLGAGRHPMNQMGHCVSQPNRGFNVPLDANGNCLFSGERAGTFSLSEMEVWQIVRQ